MSKSANKTQQYSQTIATFDENIATLKEKNDELKKDLYEATNSAEKERIMREELLLQKPNEHIFILPLKNDENEIVAVESHSTIFERWKTILQL